MSLVDDMNFETMEEAAPEAAPDFSENETGGGGVRFSMPDFSFLAAPTGNGPIEDYVDHPLNFDGAKSTARILRGCTGLCGSLDYALIDIGLGIIEKIKEKKKPNETFNKPAQ